MGNKRKEPIDRRYEILMAAIAIAEVPGGFSTITRESVATKVGCADSLVSRYFGTMPTFKRDIMRAAVAKDNLSIIAQGLALSNPYAQKASDEIKTKALASLK